MKSRSYKESQSFHPMIKWIIISSILGITLYSIISIVLGNDLETDYWLLIFMPTIMIMVSILILNLKLHLSIDDNSISYQLKPLEWKVKHILKEDIQSISIRNLKWYQHSGFGKRRKITNKSVAYVMKKGPVLEIILKNGSKRLFSVENISYMENFIKSNFNQLYIK